MGGMGSAVEPAGEIEPDRCPGGTVWSARTVWRLAATSASQSWIVPRAWETRLKRSSPLGKGIGSCSDPACLDGGQVDAWDEQPRAMIGGPEPERLRPDWGNEDGQAVAQGHVEGLSRVAHGRAQRHCGW